MRQVLSCAVLTMVLFLSLPAPVLRASQTVGPCGEDYLSRGTKDNLLISHIYPESKRFTYLTSRAHPVSAVFLKNLAEKMIVEKIDPGVYWNRVLEASA